MTPTLDAALLISSRAGADLGQTSEITLFILTSGVPSGYRIDLQALTLVGPT